MTQSIRKLKLLSHQGEVRSSRIGSKVERDIRVKCIQAALVPKWKVKTSPYRLIPTQRRAWD